MAPCSNGAKMPAGPHFHEKWLGGFQSLKLNGGVFIEVENRTRREVLKQSVQPGVGFDLLIGRFCPGDEGEPASHLFLKADNRDGDIIVRGVKSLYKIIIFRPICPSDDT